MDDEAAVQRLDSLLFERGMFSSREKARRAVMAGLVEVEGRLVDKPGTAVRGEVRLSVRGGGEPFVSRAGRKLAAALDHFAVAPRGLICLDIGASTGGFTDCLLQRGARRVYAVDVGYGQLDQRLREDPRVIVMERINARYLEPDAIKEVVQLVTIDVSFISLSKIVPAVLPMLATNGCLLPLIKPQFEAGKGKVSIGGLPIDPAVGDISELLTGGIVRDAVFRRQVIDETVEALEALGLECHGCFDSPVVGSKGNKEAFAIFEKGSRQ